MSWWNRLAAAMVGQPNQIAVEAPAPPAVQAVARDLGAAALRDGLYDHWTAVPWPADRWPNFSPKELACRHCGEAYIDRVSIDMLQRAREAYGAPLRINCGHRCAIHNAQVGGAPKSQHKLIAFDVSIRSADRWAILKALERAGFTTFGFYQTFIHTDIRPGRRWYSGEKARQLWTS